MGAFVFPAPLAPVPGSDHADDRHDWHRAHHAGASVHPASGTPVLSAAANGPGGARGSAARQPGWLAATLGLLGALLIRPGPLHAQSASVQGTVALSSQLVDRGIATTRDIGVVQAAASWSSPSGWSLGVAGATRLQRPGDPLHLLAEATRYWPLSPRWQMQSGLVYYHYLGKLGEKAYDRVEANVGWTYRDVLTMSLAAEQVVGGGSHHPRAAADIGVRWPLPWQLSATASAGIAQSLPWPYGGYNYGHANHYGYGQAGLAWDHRAWHVEVDRMMTSARQRNNAAPQVSRWAATLSLSF